MSNSLNIRNRRVAYPNQSFDAALTGPTNEQLVVHMASAKNGSGAINDVGVGFTQNTTAYTVAQAGLNTNFSSKYTFDLISMALTTADTSGATFTAQYWNGTTWVALSLLNTALLTATGQANFLFSPPIDWAKDANGLYVVRFVASTTPNFAYSSVKLGEMWAYRKGVLPEANLQVRFETRPLLLQQGCSIIAFFAYPSPSNSIEVSYQTN